MADSLDEGGSWSERVLMMSPATLGQFLREAFDAHFADVRVVHDRLGENVSVGVSGLPTGGCF